MDAIIWRDGSKKPARMKLLLRRMPEQLRLKIRRGPNGSYGTPTPDKPQRPGPGATPAERAQYRADLDAWWVLENERRIPFQAKIDAARAGLKLRQEDRMAITAFAVRTLIQDAKMRIVWKRGGQSMKKKGAMPAGHEMEFVTMTPVDFAELILTIADGDGELNILAAGTGPETESVKVPGQAEDLFQEVVDGHWSILAKNKFLAIHPAEVDGEPQDVHFIQWYGDTAARSRKNAELTE